MATKKITKIEEEDVITAIFKVNLHCQQCALDIKKPLLKTEGVRNVEADNEKGEIKVKGSIDIIKIHRIIERVSNKRVALISPQPKTIGTHGKNITKEKETKQFKETSRTIIIKVHMHCDKCEIDLRKKLLKQRGIYKVKTDMKAQTLKVQGTIESDELLTYIRKKVHKSATIVTYKIDETEQSRGQEVKVANKEKTTELIKEKKATEVTKWVPPNEIIELQMDKKVEVKTKEGNTSYFIHYVYAPQLFSDENPNACFIL